MVAGEPGADRAAGIELKAANLMVVNRIGYSIKNILAKESK
jgi:hypothetical protein